MLQPTNEPTDESYLSTRFGNFPFVVLFFGQVDVEWLLLIPRCEHSFNDVLGILYDILGARNIIFAASASILFLEQLMDILFDGKTKC